MVPALAIKSEKSSADNIGCLSKLALPLRLPRSNSIKLETNAVLPMPIKNDLVSHPIEKFTKRSLRPESASDVHKCIVQFASPNDPLSCWIMLAEFENELKQFVLDINSHMSMKSISFNNPSDLKRGAPVAVQHLALIHRAVVCDIYNDKAEALVRLIDFGYKILVKFDLIKVPIQMMTDVNSFAFQVKFKSPRLVHIGDKIDLDNLTKENNDLYIVGETDSKNIKDNSSLSISNLKVMPIPENQPINLYCFDTSQFETRGFLTAGIFVNQEKIEEIEIEMTEKMTKYCEEHPNESFVPKIKDICLAMYDLDSKWYRALCLDANPEEDTFSVFFIDFGNESTVSSINIRKITEEFSYPTFANRCVIKGNVPIKRTKLKTLKVNLFNYFFIFQFVDLPKEMPKETVMDYFDCNNIFPVERAMLQIDGTYLLEVNFN